MAVAAARRRNPPAPRTRKTSAMTSESSTEDILARIAGTNIDGRSLLSTDYFNHFNEVIMLLGMLPDMPDMLDEVDKWEFKTYPQHFAESGLGFAPLAIEAYEISPLREKFDNIAIEIRDMIIETRVNLRHALEEGQTDKFAEMCRLHSLELQGLVDDGGAVVHGYDAALDQGAIDSMF